MLENTPIVTLTESAVTHIKKIIANKNGIGFRIALKEKGCLGFSYDIDVVTQENPEDHQYVQDGITIFIDRDSTSALKGLVLDLVNIGLGQGQLQFHNPNAVATCGCGESFSIKEPGESK